MRFRLCMRSDGLSVERLKAVSDEALIDLDLYTDLLAAKRKKN